MRCNALVVMPPVGEIIAERSGAQARCRTGPKTSGAGTGSLENITAAISTPRCGPARPEAPTWWRCGPRIAGAVQRRHAPQPVGGVGRQMPIEQVQRAVDIAGKDSPRIPAGRRIRPRWHCACCDRPIPISAISCARSVCNSGGNRARSILAFGQNQAHDHGRFLPGTERRLCPMAAMPINCPIITFGGNLSAKRELRVNAPALVARIFIEYPRKDRVDMFGMTKVGFLDLGGGQCRH